MVTHHNMLEFLIVGTQWHQNHINRQKNIFILWATFHQGFFPSVLKYDSINILSAEVYQLLQCALRCSSPVLFFCVQILFFARLVWSSDIIFQTAELYILFEQIQILPYLQKIKQIKTHPNVLYARNTWNIVIFSHFQNMPS